MTLKISEDSTIIQVTLPVVLIDPLFSFIVFAHRIIAFESDIGKTTIYGLIASQHLITVTRPQPC